MPPMQTVSITSEEELKEAIGRAAAAGERLAIRGGGSKDGIGRGLGRDEMVLALDRIAGIVDYDPPELVLTVLAGTPLAHVESLLASQNQMLAFAPFDHAVIFGGTAGRATIGGVVAAGVAGSQRLWGGGARDHLLGFRAVSGRGESFVAGGKVVKNVTGYDLCKLAAGSWGRLFAMTELTLKVLPAPRTEKSCVIEGLDASEAVAAMAAAMGAPVEVAAAAHLPADRQGRPPRTVMRVQGFEPSVAARMKVLCSCLARFGAAGEMDESAAQDFWAGMRSLAPLGRDGALWRVSVPSSRAPEIVQHMRGDGVRWALDWAGGLVWLSGAIDPHRLRRLAERCDGHAMLVHADPAMREVVPAFHPRSRPVAMLEERIRRAFDPAGVFETGRFAETVRED